MKDSIKSTRVGAFLVPERRQHDGEGSSRGYIVL
uniref:Uncharacterized protein n=1 Tax=Siphoviridae sp. ctoRD1 TaxID=2825669 RepID=A0A8S5QE27_9CAUD|nr:MAG TPA: hypothetical protein [Siphoviridae sp. ctoRD1]DAI55675.1 MAG TPA: hypothetical protein [Caudoviricetes sp.]